MSKSPAQIKKEILKPDYIELHGHTVEYHLRNVHRQVGEIHSDRYTFPELKLDKLIDNAIDSRPTKYASAIIRGKHTQYDAVTGDPNFPRGKPSYTRVDLELTLEMVKGYPKFTVKETND